MLACEQRPASLSGLIGQPEVSGFLSGWLARVRAGATEPLALLASGPSGTGKTTIAHVLAGELGCDFSFERVDSQSCDLAKVTGKSNYTDSIPYWLSLSTWEAGGWKVLLIDEAHTMTPAAKNAFLGLLERLPARRVIVFTTTEPLAFDLTWRSRCVHLELVAHTVPGLVSIMRQARPSAPKSALRRIAEASEGNARLALNKLDIADLSAERVTVTLPAGAGVAARTALLRAGFTAGAAGQWTGPADRVPAGIAVA